MDIKKQKFSIPYDQVLVISLFLSFMCMSVVPTWMYVVHSDAREICKISWNWSTGGCGLL